MTDPRPRALTPEDCPPALLLWFTWLEREADASRAGGESLANGLRHTREELATVQEWISGHIEATPGRRPAPDHQVRSKVPWQLYALVFVGVTFMLGWEWGAFVANARAARAAGA